MDNKFELILSTESRVLSTNIADFEKQAEQFLSTLTNKFETDEDFGAVAEEIKTLEDVEKKIRAAIKSAQSGEIAKLIESAERIAEKFRQERLNREKLVKAKKEEVKQGIVDTAFKNISQVRYSYESDISLALEKTMPKQDLFKRLQGATERAYLFRMREDYAYKYSAAMAFEGYKKQIQEQDPTLQQQLLQIALDNLGKNPTAVFDKELQSTPLETIIESVGKPTQSPPAQDDSGFNDDITF